MAFSRFLLTYLSNCPVRIYFLKLILGTGEKQKIKSWEEIVSIVHLAMPVKTRYRPNGT